MPTPKKLPEPVRDQLTLKMGIVEVTATGFFAIAVVAITVPLAVLALVFGRAIGWW